MFPMLPSSSNVFATYCGQMMPIKSAPLMSILGDGSLKKQFSTTASCLMFFVRCQPDVHTKFVSLPLSIELISLLCHYDLSSTSSSSSSITSHSLPLGIAVDCHHTDMILMLLENFLDNYDLNCADGNYYTLSQKMVLHAEPWSACKAFLAFHAGLATSNADL